MLVEFVKNKEGRNLSKSAYKILEMFENKGENSISEIKSELDFSTRAIQYSLQRLTEKEILDKRPYLQDMRQSRYMLSETLIAQMNLKYRHM